MDKIEDYKNLCAMMYQFAAQSGATAELLDILQDASEGNPTSEELRAAHEYIISLEE
jgi:hypothetical protein